MTRRTSRSLAVRGPTGDYHGRGLCEPARAPIVRHGILCIQANTTDAPSLTYSIIGIAGSNNYHGRAQRAITARLAANKKNSCYLFIIYL